MYIHIYTGRVCVRRTGRKRERDGERQGERRREREKEREGGAPNGMLHVKYG